MSRNFGIPNVTSRPATGTQPLTGSHYARGRAHSNSLAGDPPNRPNLAVVRDSSFLHQHELNPVERLDAELDHREFAACVIFSVLITFTFGLPIAIAVAFMSFG